MSCGAEHFVELVSSRDRVQFRAVNLLALEAHLGLDPVFTVVKVSLR